MKKIYHLSSCNTCQKIIQQISPGKDVELQDIKVENIDAETLDFLKGKVGSYEALFSKRAMKYRSMGLNEMNLSEADYRKYMLEEYTFLKRPFMINEDEVFIGNAKKTVEEAVASFNKQLKMRKIYFFTALLCFGLGSCATSEKSLDQANNAEVAPDSLSVEKKDSIKKDVRGEQLFAPKGTTLAPKKKKEVLQKRC